MVLHGRLCGRVGRCPIYKDEITPVKTGVFRFYPRNFVSWYFMYILWLFFFLFLSPLAAIELEIRFPLLEKQLAAQLFTQDGRRYVKGGPSNRCNFAYLASPKFASRQGKLLIQARFTGRSSLDVFGKCVGFGDSFDLEILSALETKDGTLLLAKPEVKSLSRDTFYSRQVVKALQASVADAVRYPIREEIRKILEAGAQSSVYQVKIQRLEIRLVQVLEDSLLVDVDTRLKVESPSTMGVAPPRVVQDLLQY
jgi:hypothetical protein